MYREDWGTTGSRRVKKAVHSFGGEKTKKKKRGQQIAGVKREQKYRKKKGWPTEDVQTKG